MARMYSRRKGKSGSKKPVKKSMPSWMEYKPKEIELLIAKLAKEGKSSSQIGAILRDSYGVPDVRTLMKKKITEILKEKDIAPKLPEDLIALIRKAIKLRKHFEENKQDIVSKRGLQLTESKITRLVKYYKKSGKLPADWTYDYKSIKLYIE